MNDALTRRPAAISGLALAAAVALWWLGSARLALLHGSDAGRASADALLAMWLVRGMTGAVTALRVGAGSGWRSGASAALGLAAPAWPVVMLAWSASAVPLLHVMAAESALLVAGGALSWLGHGLRRVLPQGEIAVVLATGCGVVLAAALWFARGAGMLPFN